MSTLSLTYSLVRDLDSNDLYPCCLYSTENGHEVSNDEELFFTKDLEIGHNPDCPWISFFKTIEDQTIFDRDYEYLPIALFEKIISHAIFFALGGTDEEIVAKVSSEEYLRFDFIEAMKGDDSFLFGKVHSSEEEYSYEELSSAYVVDIVHRIYLRKKSCFINHLKYGFHVDTNVMVDILFLLFLFEIFFQAQQIVKEIDEVFHEEVKCAVLDSIIEE